MATKKSSKKPVAEGPPSQMVTIKPPNMLNCVFRIVGTAPYVQHRFDPKTREQMIATQKAGSTAKNKKKRAPKDFDAAYEGATYKAEDGGWFGIPAPSFRSAMIRACSLAGYKMTLAKLSVFCPGQGLDKDEGKPLVRIYGQREKHEGYVRNATGVVDIRARPIWKKWYADVMLEWDGDQFTNEDVINLLNRAGMQVGIGEGRPNSRDSTGCGWGTFMVKEVNPKPGSAPKGF